MLQFADGETQMTCLISEGPGDSQRCVEQKLVPQANALTPVHRIAFCQSTDVILESAELLPSRCRFVHCHP